MGLTVLGQAPMRELEEDPVFQTAASWATAISKAGGHHCEFSKSVRIKTQEDLRISYLWFHACMVSLNGFI